MALTRIPPTGVQTNTQFTFLAVALTATNATYSTLSGALVVSGGLGVAGSGYFGGTVTATNFIGAFAGVATTATNIQNGTAGQVPYQSAPGVTSFFGPGSVGQLLVSNGTSAPVYTSTGSIYVYRSTLADLATTSTSAGTAYSTIGIHSTGTGLLGASFNGSANQTWSLNTATLMTTSVNLAGGTAGQLVYQTGPNASGFAGPGTSGQLLVSSGASAPTYTNTASIYVGAATSSVNLFGGATGSLIYQSGANATTSLPLGTLNYILTAGASAPTWTPVGNLTAGNAVTATNIAGGLLGYIPYQTAGGLTAFIGTGSVGTVLQMGANTATFVTTSSLFVGASTSATNIFGGTTGSLHYQSSVGITAMLPISATVGATLASSGTLPQYVTQVQSIASGVASNTQATGQTLVVTAGGVGITGNSYFANQLAIGGSQASTSSGSANAFYVAGGSYFGNGMVVQGAATFAGPVTFSGSATYVLSTNTFYTDNLIELHTPPSGVTGQWASDDGKDIGFRFHYYNRALSTDSNAALVLADDSQVLEWYGSGAESNTGTFSSATYGTFKTGAIQLKSGLGNANNATSGDLQVSGGVGIGGGLFVSGTVTATSFVGAFAGAVSGVSTTATNIQNGTAGQIPYQSAPGITAFISTATTGNFLQANYTSAPTWTTTASIYVGAAAKIDTVQQFTSANYYPTFVSANNASATAMSVYTTSSFAINPSTGYVGLGTTSPVATMDVRGGLAVSGWSNNNGGSSGGLEIGWSSGQGIIQSYNRAGSAFTPVALNGSTNVFQTSGTERMRISAAGIVLINTSTASAGMILDITMQTGNEGYAGLQVRGPSSNNSWAGGISWLSNDGTTVVNKIINSTNGMLFSTANTERMRITSDGNLSIGYTSITTGTGFINNSLQVAGQISIGSNAPRAVNNTTRALTIEGMGTNTTGISAIRNGADANQFYFNFVKTRGTVLGGNDAVISGDGLGVIYWNGADGTTSTTSIGKVGASLQVLVTGAVSAGIVPSAFVFSTTDATGATPERLRITQNGGIAFGGVANYGTAGQILQSNGDAAPTWVSGGTLVAGVATTSTQVYTVAQPASANYYPAFVSANNASATGMSVYTTSTFIINPSTGILTVAQHISNGGPSIMSVIAAGLIPSTATIYNLFQNVTPYSGTNGSSNSVVYGLYNAPQMANSGVGGTNYVFQYAQFNAPVIGTTNTSSYIINYGMFNQVIRNTATDISSYASNQIYGHYSTVGNQTGTSSTAYTNIIGGYVSNAIANQGSAGSIYQFEALGNAIGVAANLTSGIATTVTNRYAFYSSPGTVGSASTVTIINSYGMYLGAPTVSTYGSIINRWGIVQADTLAASSFAGYTAVGYASTTSQVGELFAVNGGAYVNGTVTATTFVGAFSGAVTGASTQVQTTAQAASAIYYPTFVNANNASLTAMSVYTTSSHSINPANGFMTIGSSATVVADAPLTIAPMGYINTTTVTDTFIHLAGDTTKRRLLIDSTSVSGPVIQGRQANGTQVTPTATSVTNNLLYIDASGFNGIGYNSFSAGITMTAAENFTTTAAGTQIIFSTTPLQSIGTVERMRIEATGTVLINATNAYSGEKLGVNGGAYVNGILTATNIQVGTGVLIYTSGSQLLTPIPSSSIRTNAGTGNIIINGGGGTGNSIYFGYDQALSGGTYFSQNSVTLAYVSTTSGIIINNGTTAYSGAQLSVNGGAYVNGIVTATTFVGAFSGAVTGASTQVQTTAQAANATYYPVIVSANNATATAMTEYTTSSFTINPATGNHGIGASPSATYKLAVANTIQVGAQGGTDVTLIGGGAGTGSYIRGYYGTDGSQAFNIVGNGASYVQASAAGGAFSIGTSTVNTNGLLQVNGNLGMAPSTQIRQWTNADGGTLQLFATQVVTGSSNAISYSYTEGAYLASVSNGDSAILLDTGRANTLASGWARFRVVNQAGPNTSIQLSKGSTSTFYADTTNLYVGAGYTSKQVGETLGVLGGVYVSGTVTATTFVGAFTGAVTGASTQVQTTAQAANATYYPVIVSANNATATAMTEYTTSSFSINPSSGAVSLSNHTISSYLNSGSLYELTIGSRTNVNGGYIKVLNDGAVGGTRGVRLGVNGNGTAPDSGTDVLTVADNGYVGIGTTSPGYKLEVNGSFAATTKSFVIDHPTKPGMKLRYGSLEGPENGVYVRGKLTGTNIIELPEYWTKLVDPDSITVSLTSIGKHQDLYVADISNNVVTVGNGNILNKAINCFYVVYGERCDVEKLVVEI